MAILVCGFINHHHPQEESVSLIRSALISYHQLILNVKQHQNYVQQMELLVLQSLHVNKHYYRQVVLLELMVNAGGCQQQVLVQPIVSSLLIALQHWAQRMCNANNGGLIVSQTEMFVLKNLIVHHIKHKLLVILELMAYVIGIKYKDFVEPKCALMPLQI